MRLRTIPAMLLAALLLGLATAPAAFAGDRDRNTGNHKSRSSTRDDADSKRRSNDGARTRGSSESTPDQDGVGMDRGINNNDKTADGADGNNGCGNDADREDDNNGWCGRRPARDVTARSDDLEALALTLGTLDAQTLNAVLSSLTAQQRDAVFALAQQFGVSLGSGVAAPAGETAVLGTRTTRAASASSGGFGSLARTGAGVATMTLAAAGALGLGVFLLRRGARL